MINSPTTECYIIKVNYKFELLIKADQSIERKADQYKSHNPNQKGFSLKRTNMASPLYSGAYNDFKLKKNFKSNTQKLDLGNLKKEIENDNRLKEKEKIRKSPFAREISERLHLEGHYQNMNSGKSQFLTSRGKDHQNDNFFGAPIPFKKTQTFGANYAGKKNNKSMNFSKDIMWK